jgi:hypothetical protein
MQTLSAAAFRITDRGLEQMIGVKMSKVNISRIKLLSIVGSAVVIAGCSAAETYDSAVGGSVRFETGSGGSSNQPGNVGGPQLTGGSSGGTSVTTEAGYEVSTIDGGRCGGDAYVAHSKKLEIVVLFDNSLSMMFPIFAPNGDMLFPWNVAVSEFQHFDEDPGSTGIWLALKYFSENCNVDTYSQPDVPLGELPTHAAVINKSLSAAPMTTYTPTRVALEGALRFAKKRAAETGANARQVILLVTDGDPDESDCSPNTTQDVSRVAAAAFTEQPSIPIYVFETAAGVELDEVAKAGGTDRATVADLSQPGALTNALKSVRDQELAGLPCEYDLPADYFAKVNDPGLVNLMRDGTPIQNLPSATGCSEQTGGWYYDTPNAPTRILTCPSTCASLKGAAKVEVLLNCPTVKLL